MKKFFIHAPLMIQGDVKEKVLQEKVVPNILLMASEGCKRTSLVKGKRCVHFVTFRLERKNVAVERATVYISCLDSFQLMNQLSHAFRSSHTVINRESRCIYVYTVNILVALLIIL